MGRIITIANQKGGVGKTATAINLGAALANKGEHVLLVDMDSQANCSKGLGFYLQMEEMSMRDVLTDPISGISKAVRDTAVDGLDIAPSNIYLSATEVELTSRVGGDLYLTRALRDVMDRYDHIIIDPPPSLGVLCLNSIVAADEKGEIPLPVFPGGKGQSKTDWAMKVLAVD